MKSAYEIPSDIYDTVLELLVSIADATMAEDEVLSATYLEQLLDYCEEQTAQGRGCGFLWESLADATSDIDKQITYYDRGVGLARLNREPLQTTLLALAECHLAKGDRAHAKSILHEARQQAISEEDADTEGAATALLQQIPD